MATQKGPHDSDGPISPRESSIPTQSMLDRLQEGKIVEKLILINRLGKMNSPLIISPLFSVVRDGKVEIIESVAEVVASNPTLFQHVLKSKIKSENCFVRWTIALAILKMGESKYVRDLIPAIGLGYNPVVKIIVEALHSLDPQRFPRSDLKHILHRLSTSEKRKVAKNAINQLGEHALDVTETLFAMDILRYLQETVSIVPLLKAKDHRDFRVRERAIQILSNDFTSQQIFKTCSYYIKNKDELNLLYDYHLPGVRNPLPLHLYALEELGVFRDEDLISEQKAILNHLLSNGSQMEKVHALKSLIRLNQMQRENYQISQNLKYTLRSVLDSLEGSMKQYLIEQLGKLGIKWAAEAMMVYLEDERSDIRLAVIRALSKSKFETDNLMEKVAVLLVDKNRSVREATRELFWKLKPDVFGLNEGDIIDKLPEKIKALILQKMTKQMTQGSPEYRKFASFWLSVLHYKPAFEHIVADLRHSSEEVRIKAANSLALFGDKQAIKHLSPFINNAQGRFQEKVVHSVGSLGIEGIFELLHKLYNKRNGEYGHPDVLERYFRSIGGKIIIYLEKEILQEKDLKRKELLDELLGDISNKYSVNTSNDFKILL